MSFVQVLLVEGAVSDAELVVALLGEVGAEVDVTVVTTLAGALAELAGHSYDGALVDLSLPDADGLEAVARLRTAAPELPLVVLSGRSDDATALAALGVGAQDCLGKGDLTGALLLRALRYAGERSRADRAERSALRVTAALLDALESPTCAVDPDGRVLAVNEAMRSTLLAPVHCVPGDDLRGALDALGPRAGLGDGLEAVLTGSLPRVETECRSADDRWWSLRLSPMGTAGAVLTQVDVTAMKQAQDRLTVAVLHDPLTGLANRTLLRDRLQQAAAHAARAGRVVAVVFLDVDRFKAVNDTLGHAAGDEVLVAVADRLVAVARDTDTVARVSGDEFVVAWVADDAGGAATTAERLVRAVNVPVSADGRQWSLGVSAGLATGGSGTTVDELLRLADEAMYLAKSRGGGHLEVASAELRALVDQRYRVEGELGAALGEGRLEVHYQPVVRLHDGRPTGVEALVRLRARDGRLVPPGEFIEVAERSGQIVALGGEVLAAACAEAASWTGDLAGLTVAVNLSTRQLAQPDVVATVQESLRRSGLDPARLVLEVTESAVVEDAEVALAALTALKALGVRLAIDDFGTGYSSFLYLKRFPVDVLKIDCSFVGGMLERTDDAAIVASIVRLGRDVGLDLVAEGVETAAQLQHLVALGCDEAQGYLFAPPVPAGELPQAVRTAGRPVAPLTVPEQDAAEPVRALSRHGLPLRVEQVPEGVHARMAELSRAGASLHTIAAVLNNDGVRTPGGRRWHARSVARCLAPRVPR